MTKFLCSAVSAATLALACNADSALATSADVTFKLDTTGPAYSVASQDAIASMLPTTWRKGETVTVTAPNGTTTTLVADAGANGVQLFAPDAGGLWHFSNSASGSVTLGVPWSVFNDGGELASGRSSAAFIDTKKEGPNRRVTTWNALPIAYSGDSWLGSGTAASTLTINPPIGDSVEEILSGAGLYMVSEPANGTWQIALADGTTTRNATITVLVPAGFAIIFQ